MLPQPRLVFPPKGNILSVLYGSSAFEVGRVELREHSEGTVYTDAPAEGSGIMLAYFLIMTGGGDCHGGRAERADQGGL